jgi:transposase-like protein
MRRRGYEQENQNNFSPEVRERAIRMRHEHQGEYTSQWATIQSISAKVGCTPEILRRWLRETEKTSMEQEELTATELERLKAMEREVRELLGKSTKFCVRRQLILPRRNSTAHSNDKILYR